MPSLCELLTCANINNGANLQLPLDTQNQKGFALVPSGPPLELRPRPPPPDPHYRLALRALHGIQTLCSSKLILKKTLVQGHSLRL